MQLSLKILEFDVENYLFWGLWVTFHLIEYIFLRILAQCVAFDIGNFGLFTLKISCFFTLTNQKVHFVIWKASTCLKLFKYTFKPITSEILLFVYNLSAVSIH